MIFSIAFELNLIDGERTASEQAVDVMKAINRDYSSYLGRRRTWQGHLEDGFESWPVTVRLRQSTCPLKESNK